MPGDPQECRQHALTCKQMAECAATPECESFLHLSATWTRLAGELESVQGLLNVLNGGVRFDAPAVSVPDAENSPKLGKGPGAKSRQNGP